MERDTSLAAATRALQDRYDASCKRVLSERQVLARIMCACMGEYQGMDPDTVATEYIEGDPRVGADPIDRDVIDPGQVRGLDIEDETSAEGTIYFDIRYEAKSPVGLDPLFVEVDMEAQKDFFPGYPLLKRAVFYCGRLLSLQGNRVIPGSHYERVCKVFSVWVCLEPGSSCENTIARFTLDQQDLEGAPYYERSSFDLVEVVMVCLGKPGTGSGVLGMLNMLFAEGLSPEAKIAMLRDDYGMMMTEPFESEVRTMCNFSEAVLEHGVNKGIEQGIEQGIEMQRLEMIPRLVDQMRMTLSEALDFVGVSEPTEREHYAAMLGAATEV